MATIRSGMREQFDWSLFAAIATIALLGVTNLYSATSAAKASMVDIYVTQIYWIALGAVVAGAGRTNFDSPSGLTAGSRFLGARRCDRMVSPSTS